MLHSKRCSIEASCILYYGVRLKEAILVERSSFGQGLLYILYYRVRLKEAILVESSSSGQGVAQYTVLWGWKRQYNVLWGSAERGNLGGKVQFWLGVALYTVLRGTARRGNLGGKVQFWPGGCFIYCTTGYGWRRQSWWKSLVLARGLLYILY